MLGLFNEVGHQVLLSPPRRFRFLFPTSLIFASAGASKYRVGKFLTVVVAICRGARYALIAFIADHYGRHFIRILRHPTEYWGWLLAFAAIIIIVDRCWNYGEQTTRVGCINGLTRPEKPAVLKGHDFSPCHTCLKTESGFSRRGMFLSHSVTSPNPGCQ